MGYPDNTRVQRENVEEIYDLICVGFGPASLAIAIALQDEPPATRPKVLFLEKQQQFIWHAGMLLPGSKMQISFIKDLATLRNPRSEFTFLNYLYQNNRLLEFINLGTFLPLREEYNDYMQWCAKHFDDVVSYGETVTGVDPNRDGSGKISSFYVRSKVGGIEETRLAKNVVIAVGGRPILPKALPDYHPRVVHSSQYASHVPRILRDLNANYRIAVIGAGQSAAEVFSDVSSKYPNSRTTLYIKGNALKPSDDSPFVNEIFNPSEVDKFFSTPTVQRQTRLQENKATNYSVVRIELLEQIYHDLYVQRLRNPDESTWRMKIQSNSELIRSNENNDKGIHLTFKQGLNGESTLKEEDYDLLIVATGYSRDMHQEILSKTRYLLADPTAEKFPVGRDYKVKFADGKIYDDAGIYLQGCNEDTHGLSDTLLSILSVRAGEVIKSMFGERESSQKINGHSALYTKKANGVTNGHSNGLSNGHSNGVATTSNGYH